MSLTLHCGTDEQEREDRGARLARGLYESSPQIVTVNGVVEFAPGPDGRQVNFLSNARRYWIAAKALADVMEIGLRSAGYIDDQFYDHNANLQMTVWCAVHDTSEWRVEIKSVVLVAKKGEGHATYSLGPDNKDHEILYGELSDQFEHEAQGLAGRC